MRATAFGGEVAAEAYDRLRPGYPAEAVRWLLGTSAEGLRVLDLGAGTGKLSASVAFDAHQVLALDPNEEMLRIGTRRVPGIAAIRARGEEIPLADDSVAVVVAGQSWHWMDPALAVPEVARVLRCNGALALAWNEPDIDVPWAAELVRLTSDGDPLADAEPNGVKPPPPFRRSDEHSVAWIQSLSGPSELAELAGTWSWVALHPRRQAILEAVRQLGASVQTADGRVSVPYRCHCVRYAL